MPKQIDHERYRRELLAKSFESFAEKGYAAMTMRDLARHIGVSTGTLYHYFKSKEDLFNQLVQFLTDQDAAFAAFLHEKPGSLARRVRALFEFAHQNREYFLKETWISLDFVRQHGRQALMVLPAVKDSNRRFREWIGAYLGLSDARLVDFVGHLLNGLVIDQIFSEGDEPWTAEAEILAGALAHYTKDNTGG